MAEWGSAVPSSPPPPPPHPHPSHRPSRGHAENRAGRHYRAQPDHAVKRDYAVSRHARKQHAAAGGEKKKEKKKPHSLDKRERALNLSAFLPPKIRKKHLAEIKTFPSPLFSSLSEQMKLVCLSIKDTKVEGKKEKYIKIKKKIKVRACSCDDIGRVRQQHLRCSWGAVCPSCLLL